MKGAVREVDINIGDLVVLSDRFRYVANVIPVDSTPGLLISFGRKANSTRENLGARHESAMVLWANGMLTEVSLYFLTKKE
jgi:hypothetical protein